MEFATILISFISVVITVCLWIILISNLHRINDSLDKTNETLKETQKDVDKLYNYMRYKDGHFED